jgi:hypothetical protein
MCLRALLCLSVYLHVTIQEMDYHDICQHIPNLVESDNNNISLHYDLHAFACISR